MKIMTIYGTRPEAIKVAPIIKAIEDDRQLQNVIVSTGQHREMLDQVHSAFGINPDHDLSIMSAGQTLNDIVAKVIVGVDDLLVREQPHMVLVQGDTSTVMGAAVSAFNRQVPVIHLEAGLRSGDIHSPFPEEANRLLTSRVAALHLAPTSTSKENLIREAISEDDVVVTGNSVIDALMYANENFSIPFENERLQDLRRSVDAGTAGRILLVTAHRRENLGSAMEDIGAAVADLARAYPELTIVFPIHKNPAVRSAIKPAVDGLDNVLLVEPLGYAEFTQALGMASIVLTDSGGVQEEAPSLGKPVLVMRENTERPEAVVAGTVKLVGTIRDLIVGEVSMLLDSKDAYESMANSVNPYGDGLAASRTIQAIKWKFGNGAKPVDFMSES